jgi:hypothetical protein
MDDATMIQQMTGCSEEEAKTALLNHETVLDAIESLIPANPVNSGAKYIPPKPTVDHGLDEEQAAICARGRWLQDKVNAVFSVAHSKIQETSPLVSEQQTSPVTVDLNSETVQKVEIPESERGAHV